MRIMVTDSYQEMSQAAARILAGQLYLKPDSVLGLATGSTPLLMYRKLVDPDDRIILTKGDLMGARGGTNALKIASIPEVLAAAPDDWKAQCPDFK